MVTAVGMPGGRCALPLPTSHCQWWHVGTAACQRPFPLTYQPWCRPLNAAYEAPQRPSAAIAKGHPLHFHWCRPTRQYQERRWLPDGHWQVLGFRPDLRLPVVECMASATRCDPVAAPPPLRQWQREW